MIKRSILGMAAAILFSTTAMAQVLSPTSTSTSGATSGSFAGSGSTSGSTSTTGPANAATGATTATLGLTQNSNSTQPNYVSVNSVPTVYVPNVVSGGPCAGAGASLGGAVMGLGIGGGVITIDEDCNRRQNATTQWNIGQKATALEMLCDDRKAYEANKRARVANPGEAGCSFRAEYEPKGTAPTPTQPMVPVAAVTPAPNAPTPIPTTRQACLDATGREVPASTKGAACGNVPVTYAGLGSAMQRNR
jgi:hypothetical protein